MSSSKVSIPGLIADTLRNEGIGRMYRGFTPCVARAFPANGALFATVALAPAMPPTNGRGPGLAHRPTVPMVANSINITVGRVLPMNVHENFKHGI